MSRKPEPLTIAELRSRLTITVPEYAATARVSVDAVYEAAARGELRVLRIGRRVLLSPAELLVALGYGLEPTAAAPPTEGGEATTD